MVGIVAGVALLALTLRFRAKIAAGVYNLFVGFLALRLRFNRFRKRFLGQCYTCHTGRYMYDGVAP
jgi:hypothetical protein